MGVQHVYKNSEPTSRELCAGGEACLYWFRTYRQTQKKIHAYMLNSFKLQGTVCGDTASLYSFLFLPPGNCPLRCSLLLWFLNLPAGAACFLWFLNLPSGDYWPGLRPIYTVYMVLEPTLRDLSFNGAVCL